MCCTDFLKIAVVVFAVLRGNYGRCFDDLYKSNRMISVGKYGLLKKFGLVTCTTDGSVFNISKFWTRAKNFPHMARPKKSET